MPELAPVTTASFPSRLNRPSAKVAGVMAFVISVRLLVERSCDGAFLPVFCQARRYFLYEFSLTGPGRGKREDQAGRDVFAYFKHEETPEGVLYATDVLNNAGA